MTREPPLPPHAGYINAVRDSCRAARLSANITISVDAIHRLLLSPAFTSTYVRLRTSHGYKLPLKFPSVASEINLLSVLSLLNFGSGYRVPLHLVTKRGAFDNIRALIFGMYISSNTGTGEGDYLSARGMKEIKEHTVADLMGLTGHIHVERAHESIPGITVGELGGPLWELVRVITETLNETGTVLLENGYSTLGAFVLETYMEGDKIRRSSSEGGDDVMCDFILERLVRMIPTLRDMTVVNGQPIYCFKKALLTIHAIALRPGGASGNLPNPRTNNLPIFVDNVIPSMLVHLGVIDLSTSTPSLGLTSAFPKTGDVDKLPALLGPAPPVSPDLHTRAEVQQEGPSLSVEQAYILRAAAMDACETIVKEARKIASSRDDVPWMQEMTPPELDAWIWAIAKERPDYRKLERFVLINTPFF